MRTVLFFGLLLGAASLTGCTSTEKETVKPTENALTSFISAESTISSGVRTSGPWELGVVFSSSVAGKLTQVGSKMPEPGSYRIIVWDFDSKQVLRQKTVEQTAPDKLTLDAIESLALTANKKYIISINSQSGGTNKKYGFAYKTGSADFMPFTKGSILVYNSCYRNAATPSFPDNVTNVKYELYGFPEFTFIPD
ncbi:DUF4082 domain-containing protein [Spirosoma utsteinense]|uniref:DUF4082 domain-containing protein n=1 Tax=Spirosoma utsteinense TaxID=2585773 RepID=A0ABR6W986_9BACT|nr:DUF4082 domain-containing protein [Spirosoma utsteinense]MBC3787970.1 hypothetical protein [Spirosoma utsteinense]MBC3793125.1 hypothetical protein [Spirosoma utsteinense]